MSDLAIIVTLVLFSAFFSGLTIGFFSINLTDLENKVKIGNKRAKRILPLRKRSNLLLCTLLLGNVATNAVLAIFLNSIASGVVAGFIATGLIFIIGEMVPQAIAARYGFLLTSSFFWVVWIFIVIFYPIAAPISFILDKILGAERPTVYSREEFQEIIKHHEDSPFSDIDEDEEKFLIGALSFSHKSVSDIMTPRTVIFALEANRKIDDNLLKEIKDKGFSRIPVFENTKDNIIGILYSKELIGYKVDENKTVSDICDKRSLIHIEKNMKLDELFNLFIKERRHIAFVFGEFGELKGLVTLEDVIEEILRTEIVDEADKTVDMRKLALLKRRISNK